MAGYRVTSAAVLVTVGVNDRIVERGQMLPDKVDEAVIARFEDRGWIEKVEDEAVSVEPAYPDGDPAESWTVAQLDAYAAEKGVDVSGNKPEKVAALTAALKSAE